MVADGFTITRAIQSRSWPVASANLEYAAVWGTRDEGQRIGAPRSLMMCPVGRISTLLEPREVTATRPGSLRTQASHFMAATSSEWVRPRT